MLTAAKVVLFIVLEVALASGSRVGVEDTRESCVYVMLDQLAGLSATRGGEDRADLAGAPASWKEGHKRGNMAAAMA